MELRAIVARYHDLSGSFGVAVPLEAFGYSREETERLFSILDEDYHISRFFHFSSLEGAAYRVNGFDHTHVAIDADIESIL